MRNVYKIILGVVGLSCCIILYHYFDPTESVIAPKCPFLLLTGWQCPGCGSQRAIHSFLNGHIIEGIRYNYLLLPSLVYVIMMTLAASGSRLRHAMTSSTACYVILVVFLAWWLVRNLIHV